MKSQDINIRKIKKEDEKVLGGIIRSCFLDYEAEQSGTVYSDGVIDRLYEEFSKSRAAYFVLEIDGIVMGGSGIQQLKEGDSSTCELQKMYLRKEARGQGFGRALLEKCLDFARDQNFELCYLESLPELKDALKMYSAAGFSYIDSRMGNTGYYGCSLYMTKDL